MRDNIDPRLVSGRVRKGSMASDDSFGLNGAFFITGPVGTTLSVMSSTAEFYESHGWEHVSVSLPNRCPNWLEMCFVKSLFWKPEETVVQFHPPESANINNHSYCLHMWRNTKVEMPLPPSILVGDKSLGVLV